jgi:hypothetical protein
MTKCSKTVTEIEFKFYSAYEDALAGNENYFLEVVEVEGSVPPSQITSKKMKGSFQLRPFSRSNPPDNFIEQIYLKFRD